MHSELLNRRALTTGECIYMKQGFGLVEQLSNVVQIYIASEYTPGV